MPERPVGPADPAAALADLRSARRRKRVADIHWIDALYQVYLAALVSLAAVLLLSSWIGGERLGPLRTAQVLHDGPDIVGVGVALAILIGLRSGARGGPLAIEPADARHVLLAPIDRALALRSPALHQLRFAAFVAVVVGGIGGQLAVRRLGDEPVLWILSGAAFTLTTLGLAYGAALIAGGRRLSIGVANVVGVALLGWAVADAVDPLRINIHYSPTGLVGTIPFWPLEFEPLALIAAVLAIVFVLLGVTGLGGLSLEAAERRTRLVGQLKFAATLQDLRTVMILRRQLAMELPRTKPWIRERGSGRLPVWHRGMRGVLRWPAARVVRLIGFGVVAGICLRGVANGTIPLVIVAGLALYLAALDGVESMAQEADHPGRNEAIPRPIGDLLVRHLGVGALVMTLVALVGAGVGVAVEPSLGALAVAAIAVPAAALAASGGAALSVLQGIQEPSATWDLIPPEVAGMRSAFRIAGPPVLAVIGCLPVALARSALENGGDPFGAATTGAIIALIFTALAAGWIHQREQIKAWFRDLQESAGTAPGAASRPAPATAGGGGTTSRAKPTRKPAPTRVTTSLPKKR
ncbi:MAG TPA: hypothetical protein VIT01_19175 [Acidimicrobiales bacterium]